MVMYAEMTRGMEIMARAGRMRKEEFNDNMGDINEGD